MWTEGVTSRSAIPEFCRLPFTGEPIFRSLVLLSLVIAKKVKMPEKPRTAKRRSGRVENHPRQGLQRQKNASSGPR